MLATAVRECRRPKVEPEPLLAGRYRLDQEISNRCGLARFLARDSSTSASTYVQLVRESLPEGEDPPLPADGSIWPSLAWEERLRGRCKHMGLPRVLGRFNDHDYAYLALEVPHGVNLWDAWDDPAWPTAEKFGWLIQLADLFQVLHAAGAILEELRPDQVVLTPAGQVVLTDTGNLLPLPLPRDVPIVATCATPPELLTGAWIDARSDLFCFGALVYSLLLGRELTDLDFHAPGVPKSYLERFPAAHPLLGRLLSKTFVADVDRRFPTSEGVAEDPTGFHELINMLEQCQRTLGRVRLETASWSTTGMVRSGNEDAFAVLQTSVGRQDELEDYTLVMVADGMGGSEAGEVAAALAVKSLYETLGTQPPFSRVSEETDVTPPTICREQYGTRVTEALKEANRRVYLASRQGIGRRGMGCTAEVIFSDGRHLVVGHVGDSRTYRLSRGKLTQITKDQTYISRLLEQGEITPEEAEIHPRRAELQQAIGGWSDVDPQVADVPLEPGDWVLVCSDGLSNQIKAPIIQAVLERSSSAESAARHLINLANLYGAGDNVTAVVMHAV
jgi:PPM family protein phosphatase